MKSVFHFIYFCYAVVNVALVSGIVHAAIHFGKWSLLWFLVLVLLNHPGSIEYRYKGEDGDD